MNTRDLGAFLFTDIEGSTPMWDTDESTMSAAVARHDAIFDEVTAANGGDVFTKAGDSYAVRFPSVGAAVAAATQAQQALAAETWPTTEPIRVRIGIHAGVAEHRANDWFGPAVNTAARVMSAGHGGQVLLTGAALETEPDLDATPLGTFTLRGVAAPVELFQLDADVRGDGEVEQQEFPPLRVANVDRVNLPSFPTTLFGRDDEISSIKQLLTQHRLVTIVGLGGMGKTRLAVAAAEAMATQFADGIAFVDLSGVDQADDIIPACLGALSVRTKGLDLLAEFRTHLAERRVLLLLDNCEHLIDDVAELVSDLLADGSALRLLVTSRERLDIDGEHVVLVRPLAHGAASPSRAMFLDRALSVDTSFDPTPDDLAAIDELTERLDGLPLAIGLAASRVNVLSPADLLTRLDDRFRLLAAGRRRGRSKERTLAATLDWSYQLLDEDEQALLRCLAVFPASFDARAAAAVADVDPIDAIDLLDGLQSKSLIDAAPIHTTIGGIGSRRFRLLETVRAYAEDLLATDPDDMIAARDRHTQHFLERAGAGSWERALNFAHSLPLVPDAPNVDAAMDALLECEDWTAAAILTADTIGLSLDGGNAAQAGHRIDQLVGHLGGLDDDLAAKVFYARAFVNMDRTNFTEMAEDARRCADISSEPWLISGARLMEHLVEYAMPPGIGDRTALQAIQQDSMEIATEAESRFDSMWPVTWVAYDHLRHAEYDELLAYATPFVHSPAEFFIDLVISNAVASALMFSGRAEEALDVLDGVGSVQSAWHNADLFRAFAEIELGRLDDARTHLRSAADRASMGRVPLQANDVLIGLAALAHAEGNDDRAIELATKASGGRSPESNAFGFKLAQRLGIGEQLREFAEAVFDLDLPVESADHHLRVELAAGAFD